MSTAIVTGSAGLIGSEAVRALAARGHRVVGIDNGMREYFFGADGATAWNVERLRDELGDAYVHVDSDIRDSAIIDGIISEHADDLVAVIHTAAQPSHDWAAREPLVDFGVNAVGTLNLLEAVRRHTPETPFVFMSTNKVYGDTPNRLPLVELETRWEIPEGHTYNAGVREDMSIDQTLHSVFGASKVAADVMVQEYGRYFDMPTACFRGGTLTGPSHSAAELHGFLAYLVKCALSGRPYTVYGYLGKQVRDVIHAHDLVAALLAFIDSPRAGAVYNIGGGRHSNCSVLEAIEIVEAVSGRKLDWTYSDQNRVGDHIWWIGDNGAFERDYPGWSQQYDVASTVEEMVGAAGDRWRRGV